MRSPFQFGKVVSGKAFTNRQKEKQRLISNFANGIHTILISPRRWGKSSLVKNTAEEMMQQDKNIRFCFIDLFNIRSEEDFYAAYAREVLKTGSGKMDEWMEMIRAFLGRVTPQISFGTDPVNDFEIRFEMKDQAEDFRYVLDLPEKICEKKGIQMVICLDEFQNLANFHEPLLFQKRLRASWQHHQQVTYCLYGSKRSLLMEIFESQSMPFYKFGEVFHMSKISREHLSGFICAAFAESGKEISADLANRVVDMMQCHPYYVQQLAHLVWILTDQTAHEQTLEQAVEDLLAQNAIMYRKDIESLSNTQVNFLKAISDHTDSLSGVDSLRTYKLGTSANVVKIKDALEKKEMIDTFTDYPEFVDPAFELWFKTRYYR